MATVTNVDRGCLENDDGVYRSRGCLVFCVWAVDKNPRQCRTVFIRTRTP